MKKYIWLFIFILLTITSVYLLNRKKNIPVAQTVGKESVVAGNYIGSYYKDNFVWGVAMNLAWNELNQTILHEPLQLNTNDSMALAIAKRFNESPFTKNDLDENSYYVKAGYGIETLDDINRESKNRFPDKSFGELAYPLEKEDIISYAYLFKKVEYAAPFGVTKVYFKDTAVTGFVANDDLQRKTIGVLNYSNDDKFVIQLQLKDAEDELYLAKGFDMSRPQDIVSMINEFKEAPRQSMQPQDQFEMPNLQLDHTREYTSLLGIKWRNKDFTRYSIKVMNEKIKFEMDEKGARVENEAVMVAVVDSVALPQPEVLIRNFKLDNPFWLVMKRKQAPNPFFILGVKNNHIMTKE